MSKIVSKINALGIARVSTKSQCDSLESQKKRICTYCDSHTELDLKRIENLKESAYCLKPGLLDEILGATVKNQAIILDKVDRLTRNHKDIPFFEKLIDERNISFHFIQENIVWDQNTTRDLVTKIVAYINKAEEESDSTSKRTKNCNIIMREHGKISTPAPFGYINYAEGEEKGWKPHKVNSKYVKELFEMYATGNYSIRTITEILNKKYGKSLKKPLSHQHAASLLHNKFFIGIACHDGVEYKHIYKTFITKEIFDKCQVIFKQNEKSKKDPKVLISPLYGMVRDKNTGALFTPYRNKCKKRNYLKTKDSNLGNLSEQTIIKGIKEALKNLNKDKDVVDILSNQLNIDVKENLDSLTQKAKNEAETINKLENRLVSILTENLSMSEEYMNKSIQNIHKKIETHKSILNNYTVNIEKIKKDVIDIKGDLFEFFGTLSTPNQTKMLKILFSEIQYNNNCFIYKFQKHIKHNSVNYQFR